MTDPQPDPARAEAAPRADRGRRRWHRHALRAGWLVLLVAPVVFALVAGVSMIGREITAPSWVKQLVEARAAEVLDGGSIAFGAITVTIGTDLHPQVRLRGAVLRDAAGTTLARIPVISGQISPRGLIFRHTLLMQKLRLSGPQIKLRRNADGSVAVAFDTQATALKQAPNFAVLLDQVDQVLERPELEALSTISVDGLIVNYEDARAARSWTVDGGTVDLRLDAAKTHLEAQFSLLSGRDFATTAGLTYDSPRGSRAADFALTLTQATAADLATQSAALSWLAVVDAPISAVMRGQLDAQGQLGPLNAALQMDAGAIQPTPAARPIRFQGARAYLTFDPKANVVQFDEVSLQSSWGSLAARGRASLRDMGSGLPQTLLGQFHFSDIVLNPDQLYPAPLKFDAASVDVRLRLDPLTLEVGQFSVDDAGGHLAGRARISAGSEGWRAAVDLSASDLQTARIMAFWPPGLRPLTRHWFDDNILGGTITRLTAGLRLRSGAAPVFAVGFDFTGAKVRYVKTLPPITGGAGWASFQGQGFSLVLDRGEVLAPQGGALDLAGSTFVIPDMHRHEPPATVHLRAGSTVTAALSVLDMPPFHFLTKAHRPVTLADGRAAIDGTLDFPLKPHAQPDEIGFDITAVLSDLTSDVLVPGKVLRASALDVHVTHDELRITGAAQLGQVPLQGAFVLPLGPGAGGASELTADVEISPRALDELAIGLPAGMVGGRGTGALRMDFSPDTPPAFTLSSTLAGVRLALAPLGWSKPAASRAKFEVAGVLGAQPRIDRLSLDAPGLQAQGAISLLQGGGLDRAVFSRVRAGGWLDAPVTLTGRGPGRAPRIDVSGGRINLQKAAIGGADTSGGPLHLQLDRLQVAPGLDLTGFDGSFTQNGGLSGTFTAALNGGTALRGTVLPQAGRLAVRITAQDAGGVFEDAGLLKSARGGAFEMTLTPSAGGTGFDGALKAADLNVRDAPALASLLDAVSVIGLLQQMGGQGLVFNDVQATFGLTQDAITVKRASAIGPGLGISLDGTYTTGTGMMDFQGVVSPFYIFNAIGAIISRRGEGLIGINYRMQGPPAQPRISVNPFSVLTPGIFRDIFRHAPPPGTGGASPAPQ